MKKHWKLLLSTLLLAAVLAFVGCGNNDNNGNGNGNGGTDHSATDPDDETPARDLGGLHIVWANWFTDETTDNIEWDALSAVQRERWEDRAAMEERYNFRLIQYLFGGWHDVRDELNGRLMAQDRNFQMWQVQPTWFFTNYMQGLFAPIDRAHFDPAFGINWNQSIMDLTTVGDNPNPHGFTNETGSVGGVFFNMRLLEEAGIDREYPFDLQAQGNWNWDTFHDLLRITGHAGLAPDGTRNSWALTTFHQELLNMALASNGANFATVCPDTGRFLNATTEDAFRETLEWVEGLRDEMLVMREEDVGGEWDAFRTLFNEGQGAFRVHSYYAVGQITDALVDDWGFVAFPTGPRNPQGLHATWLGQNFRTIPFFYTEAEIDDFMFAVRMWDRPLEGGDDYDWMVDAFGEHRHERSVTETMVNFTRNSAHQVLPAHWMLPDALTGTALAELFAWRLWLGNGAATIIEEGQQVWSAALEDHNARLGLN